MAITLVATAGLLAADPVPFPRGPFVGAGVGGGYSGGHDGIEPVHRGLVLTAFEAGALFHRRRLRVAVSGVAAPGFLIGGIDIESELDLRARVRLGGARGKVFGFGILGLGLTLGFIDGGDFIGGGLAGPTAELGGGVQGALGRHFALGAELTASGVYTIGRGPAAAGAARLTFTWYWPRARR